MAFMKGDSAGFLWNEFKLHCDVASYDEICEREFEERNQEFQRKELTRTVNKVKEEYKTIIAETRNRFNREAKDLRCRLQYKIEEFEAYKAKQAKEIEAVRQKTIKSMREYHKTKVDEIHAQN